MNGGWLDGWGCGELGELRVGDESEFLLVERCWAADFGVKRCYKPAEV